MIMVTTATIAMTTMTTTIAMTMGTMIVNDYGYMTATIAMTTTMTMTMTMRMHIFPDANMCACAQSAPLHARRIRIYTHEVAPSNECKADSADLLLWMHRVPDFACCCTDKLTELRSNGRRHTCILRGLVDPVVDPACEVPAMLVVFCLGPCSVLLHPSPGMPRLG